MANNLPIEIASNIATYLSRDKTCTCIRVCRSWYAVFIPTLYADVDIKGEHRFNQFIHTLCTKETLNPLGHFVRKLKLSESCALNQIASLPRLCPFVVEIDCHVEWCPELSAILQEWKYITHIWSLCFHSLQAISLDSLGSRITTSTTCVILHSDCAGVNYNTDRILYISLSELETLHGALPHLQSLSLHHVEIQEELPKHIMPCDTMQDLSLNEIRGRLWGQYFAKKYTNLKKLYLSVNDSTEFRSAGPARGDDQSEATALVRSCRYLKHFESPTNGPDNLHQRLMKLLHVIGAPLTYFELDDSNNRFVAPYPGITTIYDFHETVSKIQINHQRSLGEPSRALRALRACLNLVDLTLRFDINSLDVGCVLDFCKHLTHLDLHGCNIFVSNSCKPNDQHGLRTLSLCGAINEPVFPYLSERCPQLTYLACKWTIDDRRPYLLGFAGQNLETLKAKCYSFDEIIYKVTRIGKPERSAYWSKKQHISTDKRFPEDWTKRYRVNSGGDERPVRELTNCESGTSLPRRPKISGRVGPYIQNMFKIPIKESSYDTLTGKVIVSIQYHSVDQLYLNGTRVY